MSDWIRSLCGRGLALVQIALLLSAGCSGGPLTPTPGAAEHQAPGMLPVPGGVVNAAGGNLLIERIDITLDGIVGGTQAVGAVYNSSLPGWTWSFGVHYDGATFTDASGRTFGVTALADGAAIPGSQWVKVDADTVQTKGGLAQHFDAQGRLAVVRWATLDYPRVRYTWSAASLELAQCTAATVCAALYQIAFDASGRPLSVTEARSGRRAEYSWDGAGHLSVAKSPLEVAKNWPGTRYAYTPFGLLSSITNSEGERIEYAYQSGGRIARVTQIGEGDPTHRFEFHAADRDGRYETLYTNPLGARTRLSFDANTRLVELELVETGERRTLTWRGLRPASITFENGSSVAYEYSGDDLATIHAATGNIVQIHYEPGALNLESPSARAVRRIDDALGLVEERTFDAAGRVASLRNGVGEGVALAYNPASLLDSITQPNGATLTFPLYGAHGHWLDLGGAVTDKRSFDAIGNPRVESARGRRGGVLSQYFDPNRELASLGVAASDVSGVTGSGTITIERRSDGQPLAVRRPYGGDHEFSYDALGRMIEQRERADGQWHATRFEHDLAGNTTARSLPNGMREEWQYDGYGRVERHRALRNGSLEGEATYTYQDGQLASMYDSIRATTEQYGYDAAGRLVRTLYGYGETRSLEYDLRSRVTAEVLGVPGQVLFDIGYAYDLANRLNRTSDRAAQQTLVEHVIEAGQIVETHYGNGLMRSYTYDAAGLVVGSETRNAVGAVVESTRIERSGEMNPLRLQVRTATTTPLASTEEQYWLDAGEKLSDPGKRVFGWTRGSGSPHDYAYDELGNRRSVSDGDAFVYNAEHNRLLSAVLINGGGALGYAYDAAGFVTSRAGVPITWTATGRIASYGSATAQWDLAGRLVALGFEGASHRFDLFGGRVESDASYGSVGALDLGDVSLEPLSGARTYRHLDFRSNVSFITNDAGDVTNHYRYGPYGVDHAFGIGANRNTFVGKGEAGPFLILGARFYDPAIGRFISSDPAFDLFSQYTYTQGNPVGFWDPDGARSEAVAVGVDIGSFVLAGVTFAVAIATGAGAVAIGLATAGLVLSGIRVANDMGVFDDLSLPGIGAPDGWSNLDMGAPAALDMFRSDPCNSQCAFPPFPEEPWASSGANFVAPARGGSAIGVIAPNVHSPAPTGCSPSTISGGLNVSWALIPLLGLQVLLGVVLLRRQRRPT